MRITEQTVGGVFEIAQEGREALDELRDKLAWLERYLGTTCTQAIGERQEKAVSELQNARDWAKAASDSLMIARRNLRMVDRHLSNAYQQADKVEEVEA